MRNRRWAVVALAGVLASARAARADIDVDVNEDIRALPQPALPNARWFTLVTPHFELHFYPEEREFAEKAAVVAERAYRLITMYLNWEPSGRVSVLLSDATDGANGGATSVPYNFIYAYGVPPDGMDELSDFDDFVKLLLTHEFTHVVHLDTILSWCPRFVDSILGKIYAPNLSQPTWFIEGLAVLMETRHTTAGRLRSTFYDMHLRTPFLEGQLLKLDKVTVGYGPLVYPGGTVPYLYGSSILRYIEDRYGPEKIREISHRYANECVAGGINRVAFQALGRPYTSPFGGDVWHEWTVSMSHRYSLQKDEAERRGLTTARRLTFDAPAPRGVGPRPVFFRDGTLVYERQNTDQVPAYVRLDINTGARETLASAHGGGPAAPTPDGRGLVIQRLSFLPLRWRIGSNPPYPPTSYTSWNDIYYIDLAGGSVRPITRGYRAHEPDVSPDGAQVVCALTDGSARQLAVVPIQGGAPRVLAPDLPGLVYTPTFSPDGRLIAYSRMKPGGFRDIHLYDLAAGTDRALTVDRAMDVDPRFTPDGRWLLWTSDRTGIYDVYAYEMATAQLYQVTNVLTGAFQPAVSMDGSQLVYTGFSSEGFDLYAMPFDPKSFRLAQPFANMRPDSPADLAADSDSPDSVVGDAPPPTITRTTTYKPWKYMYPRQWSISFYSDALGMGSAGYISTNISDPVVNHTIGANLLVPVAGDPSVAVNYSYNRLFPAFSLSFRRTAQNVPGLIVDGVNTTYRQHVIGATASTSMRYLQTAASYGDLALGYDYNAYGPADPLPLVDPTNGIVIPPERGPDANVFLIWNFDNRHNWPYSISTQEGRRVQLNLRFSDPALGGRFRTTEISGSWQEYLTAPWARLHVLALLWSGGVGLGDKRDFFALGGFAEQDILRSVFLNRAQCCTYLRGYPTNSFIGDAYQIATAEYRAPLLRVERGYQTFPTYLRQLWGAAFVDVGNAYEGRFQPGKLKLDVGAEANLGFNIFYYLESQLKIGYAHGFSALGGDQVYLLAAGSF
jgi:surface antigen Omp85-like protein/WD40 repeat protein